MFRRNFLNKIKWKVIWLINFKYKHKRIKNYKIN